MIVLITDPRHDDISLATIVSEAARAIPSGNLAVLLRDHTRDDFNVTHLATQLRKITRDHGHLFLVKHHHRRVAAEVGADGVHVNDRAPNAATYREGWSDRVIVSVPAHSDTDVTHAAMHGVDWVLVSPIFTTPNKGAPRGLSAIRNAAEITSARASPKIIALGGVDASNAASCLEAGADGIAVIRAILDASDPFEASRALWGAVIASKQR